MWRKDAPVAVGNYIFDKAVIAAEEKAEDTLRKANYSDSKDEGYTFSGEELFELARILGRNGAVGGFQELERQGVQHILC